MLKNSYQVKKYIIWRSNITHWRSNIWRSNITYWSLDLYFILKVIHNKWYLLCVEKKCCDLAKIQPPFPCYLFGLGKWQSYNALQISICREHVTRVHQLHFFTFCGKLIGAKYWIKLWFWSNTIQHPCPPPSFPLT